MIYLINYIKGRLDYIDGDCITVEAYGIGYCVQVSGRTLSRLHLNEEVRIFTYMNISENDISLFGFLSREELDMFNRLKTVNGVGGKSAMSILDTLSPSEISVAIVTEDIKQLSRCPGIGRKTAQRIALELKDKISNEDMTSGIVPDSAGTSREMNEALEALTSLGFSRSEAVTALSGIDTENAQSGALVSMALKRLNRS